MEEIGDAEKAQEKVEKDKKNKQDDKKTFTQPIVTCFFQKINFNSAKECLKSDFFGGDLCQKGALNWCALNRVYKVFKEDTLYLHFNYDQLRVFSFLAILCFLKKESHDLENGINKMRI